jgi:hypothetical protein
VEGLPELGDDKEIFALYEALLDRAGNALAGFDFIAVICIESLANAPVHVSRHLVPMDDASIPIALQGSKPPVIRMRRPLDV